MPTALKSIVTYLSHFCFGVTLARKIVTPTVSSKETVDHLLNYSTKQHATHIYLEPDKNRFTILLRVNGSLQKITTISLKNGKKLIQDIEQSTQKSWEGKYHVKEAVLHTSTPGKQHTFNTYFIPRPPSHSVIIKNNAKQYRVTEPTPLAPTANINKKIFIWQMGKVGSLSVYNSLLQHTKPTNWQPPEIARNKQWPVHNNIMQTHSLKMLYDFMHHSDEEFIIISLVRDLLSRNISSIFQSMNFSESWRNEYFIASINQFKKMRFKEQKKQITKQLYRLNTSGKTTCWYDNILKSHFYYPNVNRYFIDIYAKPFDKEKGYQIYESCTPRIKMIILRLEDLDNLGTELGNFLNIKNFHLSKGNFATDKWYQDIYERFKQEYHPSTEEIESLYNSKFMKYFYTPEQITKFTTRHKPLAHPHNTHAKVTQRLSNETNH